MLEALEREHPGALDLPEHGEISSYIGSLVARKKQGKLGPPKSRAPPVSGELKKAIRDLHDKWDQEDPKHKVMRGGTLKTYAIPDIYRHLRAMHDRQFRIPDKAKFKKLFDEDTYPGEIKEYCEEEMFYRVAYEDGDAEDLYFIELEPLLDDKGSVVRPVVAPKTFPTGAQISAVVSAHRKAKKPGPAVNPVLRAL
jgi:hypothetical protein